MQQIHSPKLSDEAKSDVSFGEIHVEIPHNLNSEIKKRTTSDQSESFISPEINEGVDFSSMIKI